MLEGSEELTRSLDEYVRLVVRRRWWLILPTCLVALATVMGTFLLPDVYRSETLILVEHQKVPEHYVVSNITSDLRDRLQTMTQQILSRVRLLKIIEEFDLYRDRREELVPEELVALMRSNIQVELVGGNRRRDEPEAFKLFFSSENPRVAQQVASRLTSLFIEENLRVREQQSRGTTEFLETQLEEARQELQVQEKRLGEFKRRYLGQLPEQQGSNLQILGGLQGRLQGTMAALNQARQQRVYLESMLTQYRQMAEQGVRSGEGPPASSAAFLAEELDRLQKQRMALLARYTPKHPDIVKIEEEIAQAETLLAQMKQKEEKEKGEVEKAEEQIASEAASSFDPAIAQFQSQLKANQAEIDDLERARERLENSIAEYQRRLNLTPVREEELADLVRNYNLSKRHYEELLAKKLDSQLATSMEKRQQGEQFRIVDPPSFPQKPSKPDRVRLNLLGGALGFGLAVGFAFLVEIRDRSLYSEKDLARVIPQHLTVGIPELLTPRERRRLRWKRLGEWVAGVMLVVAVVAAEGFAYWRG